MFIRISPDWALIFRQGQAARAINLSSTPPSTGGTVTPVLTVGYVDTSGVPRATAVISGVTTITGVAPFFVSFNGFGTTSTDVDSDTPEKAFWGLSCLIDYGENLGGTWSVTGRPRDTDRGPAIYAHGYQRAGTHMARVRFRNFSGQEVTVQVNIVVTDPGEGVDMTPGVLPTFADNTVYNAPAGGTWPSILSQLDGRSNIIIRKTGEGADPVFGTVTLDSRNEPNFPITRTRGIRFQNCDVAGVNWGNVGFDYCAFIGGRVRGVSFPNMSYAADELLAQGRTQQQAENVRNARGLLLQDTGTLGESEPGYVLIAGMRHLHLKNVILEKTSTGQHNTRGIFKDTSFRHILANNTVAGSVSYFKFQGQECTLDVDIPQGNTGTPDPWPESDMVVTAAGGRKLGLPCSTTVVVDFICGLSGSDQPDANAGFGPENNDAGSPAQGCELSGFAYGRWVWPTAWYDIDMSGRYLGVIDCRLDGGNGAPVPVTWNQNHTNRTPVGWSGPVYSSQPPAPTPFPVTGVVTPDLQVEYVDIEGNLQSVSIVNGVTNISGVAPFLVHFDASGTRSAVADTRAKAVMNTGYRFNYGENLGTTWTYPEGAGLSKDEDIGPPLTGRVFTTTGTHTVRVKCRDASGNEGTISLTVTVTAPPAPTLIPVSAGSWPALSSGAHYTLEAGGDYRSWGSPPTTGLRNILFSKAGAGADPRLGTVSYDSRHGVDVSEAGLDALYTRNIRYLDCDIETLDYKWFGPQYCGVIRGRARVVTQISQEFIWDNDNAGSANLRLSMRYPRGCFLWDLTGPCVSINGGEEAYVWLHGMYKCHYYGFDLQHSPVNNNSGAIARVYPHFSDYRYGRLTALTSSTGLNGYIFMLGVQGFEDLGVSPVEVPESGAIAYATGGMRPNVLEMGWMVDCQFGSSGSIEPTITAGINRARSSGGSGNVGGRLSGLENIRVQRASPSSSGRATVEQGGADIALRNIKWDMGAGQDANFTQLSSVAPFDGPYLTETTNTRPVPTPFVSGTGPTAILTATQTTGPAPLAVLFDASASELGDTGTYAFHDLDYTFTFDDPSSGTWAISGLSKNTQTGGPIAAHVFETPGTYTVMVGVVDSLGRSAVNSIEITVTDPDIVFSGTNTVVVATDGNFTGAPSGSTQVTSLAAVGSFTNKRVLLKRGQSFGSLSIPHSANTFQIGAWSTGAKPQVDSVAISPGRATAVQFANTLSISDLDIANGIEQTASGHRMLFLRCDLNDASTSANNMITIGGALGWWATSDPSRIIPTGSFYWPREIFVVDCTVRGSADGDNTPFGNLYGAGSRWAIMGCDMGGATEHTVRLFKAHKMFIGHNRLRGISQAGIRHSLKLHSGGFDDYNDSYGISGETWKSSHIVVANNIGGDPTDNNDWTFAIRPQNTGGESGEGIEDVILENNTMIRGIKTSQDILVVGRRISVRGTTLSGGGSPAISTDSGTTYTNLPSEWRGPYFIE